VIDEIDSTLIALLESELESAPPLKIEGKLSFTFERPLVTPSGVKSHPSLNLYLHDIRENIGLRDDTFQYRRRTSELVSDRQRAPVRMSLGYLVTAHAATSTEEHRLLGWALEVFYRNAVIPSSMWPDSIKGIPNAITCTVAQPDQPAHQDICALWRAMGLPIQPSLGLAVTTAFNPFDSEPVRLVQEAILAVGQGAPPSGENRNLDLHTKRVALAGVATDARGKAIERVCVSVTGFPGEVFTNHKGVFLLLDLPEGTHEVHFKHPMHIGVVRNLRVEASSDGLVRPITIRLAVPTAQSNHKASISRGRLLNAKGEPLAFVSVQYNEFVSVTDRFGEYTFSGPAPDEYLLKVQITSEKAINVAVHTGKPTVVEGIT